jgi:thiol-disulfide isomerase/thioredoxin
MESNNDHTFAACLKCHAINKVLHQYVPQAVCFNCQSPIKFKKLVSESIERNFKDLVQKSDLVLIAYFSTPFCMACKIFNSQFEKASIENLNMVFTKVNIQGEDPFAAFMEIKAYPCLILFKNGFEEKRHYGIMNDLSLKEFIQ